jgi:transcriptional regulator of arginine metabolism
MANTQKIEDHILLDVISQNQISSQQALLEKVLSLGYDITQSTLSRQLRRLGISKVNGTYHSLIKTQMMRSRILHMDISLPNLLVIHTNPAEANALAAHLDKFLSWQRSSQYEGLLGTIAGDDTILVIAKDAKSLEALYQAFQRDFMI